MYKSINLSDRIVSGLGGMVRSEPLGNEGQGVDRCV